MDRRLSVYLDLLRFSAAVTVLLCHATYARYTTQFAGAFGPFGHDAVIVFFVLSGYVIAYVSDRKEHTARDYALSRAARIYSVALPAIALTIVLDSARMWIDPSFFEYQFHELWAYLPFYSVFGTDWWFLNEDMLSNSPFWSLSYEVWYYVLFGALFYLRGRWRWICAGAVLALIGPRQWLLFPIWLAGCALYYRHEQWRLSRTRARWLFFGSMVVYALVKSLHGFDAINGAVNQLLADWPHEHLRYSQFFIGDYLIGGLVLVNIFAARYCEFRAFAGRARFIRFAASFTFSLYLFHMPLLKFYSAIFHTDTHSVGDYGLLLAAVVATVVLLGLVTERKKHVARAILEKLERHAKAAYWRVAAHRGALN